MSLFGVIGLYNLLLFLVIKKKIYLHYCFMVLGFFGHVSTYWLRAPYPEFSESLSVITASFTVFGALLFSRTFLKINQGKYPFWNRTFSFLMIAGLCLVFLQAINLSTGVNQFLELVLSFTAAFCALASIIVELSAAISLWKREKMARLYFYNNIPTIIGSGIYIIRWLVLESEQSAVETFEPTVAIMFGAVLLQMILFSIVIGYNLKELEGEKFELQRGYARKLEQEVQEQTKSLVEAKDRIEEQRSELLANNKFKNKLFSLIAHDLRNPLTSLLGLVDVLAKEDLSKKDIEGFVLHQQKKIKTLISSLDRILKWSYAQLEGIQIRKVKIELQDVVKENLSLMDEKIAAKKLTISNHLISAEVLADRDMIDTVIRNILVNAIKFSHEGGTITLKIEKAQSHVILSIVDEGIGMDARWLTEVEKSGEIVIQEGTSGEKGQGFGLLISQDFVKMNGGTLYCESTVGKGTTFFISLLAA